MCKHHCPVYKITEDGYEFIIVPRLEIFPSKIIVLGFRGIGTQHVPEDIFLSRKFLQILLQPYSPVAGSGNLIPLKVEELIGRDIVRQYEIAIRLQHGRENDTMEDNIVLADKMYKFRIFRLPPFLP